MAIEVGKAYVQIIPSAKGISGSISQAIGGEATSAGKSAGLNIVGAIKGVVAAAGIGVMIKKSLDAGGALQQSFGGLDTIYGEAADAAKKYAAEASKAGISSNSYAEQAVSFGASLKQAYGGDTVKAVEAANTAILDMADNSAKMGTDISAIQNAYQGFAKQNYTMLDNLKLGYGGTKGEMERLLKDAEKLSGVKYDISNLGDVYSAIHVIQEDLGLTGVAAAEAEGTFTGSMGAMKASAENLLANLALGNSIESDLETLFGNAQAFVMKNLAPMVGNILKALPTLLSGVSKIIIDSLNMVSQNSGEIVQMALDFVISLVEAIVAAAPYVVQAAFSLVTELGKALLETDWLSIGSGLITNLNNTITEAAGSIFGSDSNIITAILNSISASLPNLLTGGVEIVNGLVNGILTSIPSLMQTAGDLMLQFTLFIYDAIPALLQAGADILLNLINGIIENAPQIFETMATVIADMIAGIGEHLPEIFQQGIEIIGKLAAGLIAAIPKALAAIPKILLAIAQAFLKYNWAQIGIDILIGIKNGIISAIGQVVDAAKQAAQAIWDTIKGYFQIGSPSKLMWYGGDMLDEGWAGGIKDNQYKVTDAIGSLNKDVMSSLETSPTVNSLAPQDNRVDTLINILNQYLPIIADGENVSVHIEADAGRMFREMQRQSIKNTQMVGVKSVLSAV